MLSRFSALCKASLAIAGIAGLSACAPVPSKPQTPVVVGPAPTCEDQRQCEAMWAKVPEMLPRLTFMRIRLATDTLVETFPTRSAGRTTGRVFKRPSIGGKGYTFEASFNCGYDFCQDEDRRTLAAFNQLLTSYGKIYAPTASK